MGQLTRSTSRCLDIVGVRRSRIRNEKEVVEEADNPRGPGAESGYELSRVVKLREKKEKDEEEEILQKAVALIRKLQTMIDIDQKTKST